MIAAFTGRSEVITLLVDRGANIQGQNNVRDLVYIDVYKNEWINACMYIRDYHDNFTI